MIEKDEIKNKNTAWNYRMHNSVACSRLDLYFFQQISARKYSYNRD